LDEFELIILELEPMECEPPLPLDCMDWEDLNIVGAPELEAESWGRIKSQYR
jgi:hypothetical protein